MINKYKRILVGQDADFDIEKKENDITVFDDDTSNNEYKVDQNGKSNKWKDKFALNPEVNEYGDGKAQIVDYAIIDEEGELSSSIIKGTKYKIKTKIHFNEDMSDPIFTMTIKNIKGIDITGTNTMVEKVDTGMCRAGEEYTCTFEQKMNLQGGEYLLSVSCTGYNGTDFVVHHRLYDVVGLTVISDKNTVGFYDMESKVEVQKVLND
jgi:teichoic acid transport system ATP-binding protein